MMQQKVYARTLYETRQHLTSRLQQRMSRDNLQEPLQPLPSVLNDVVAEPVGKNLARQWGDSHSCALTLQDIAEVLEVGVAAAHDGVLQLEGGDVGSADDLVGGVHVAGSSVGLRVAHLSDRVRAGLWRCDVCAGCVWIGGIA